MRVAVGLMAYNEAANVASALRSILDQQGPRIGTLSVVVVASGCTDGTTERAQQAAAGDPRAHVLVQAVREGKASAVTAFLTESAGSADVLVLAGADTRLDPGSLEALLVPFDDPAVGMTGGRPVPVNDDRTLMGGVVHLLWELHHEVAMYAPKLGELVAFRPVIAAIPSDTAVDEATLESAVRAKGLGLAYAPGAIVRMKGPVNVAEFLTQRRRIHAGHLRLRRTSGHAVSTLSPWAAVSALARRKGRAAVRPLVLGAAVALEGWARLLGAWDARAAGRDHRAWEPIPSTKDLTP